MSAGTNLGARKCWHCGRQFRTKRGGGYTFAIVKDPIGNELRLHKDCVRHVVGDGYQEVSNG